MRGACLLVGLWVLDVVGRIRCLVLILSLYVTMSKVLRRTKQNKVSSEFVFESSLN